MDQPELLQLSHTSTEQVHCYLMPASIFSSLMLQSTHNRSAGNTAVQQCLKNSAQVQCHVVLASNCPWCAMLQWKHNRSAGTAAVQQCYMQSAQVHCYLVLASTCLWCHAAVETQQISQGCCSTPVG